jgi:hypothetical protein
MNKRLKLISGGERLALGPTDGQETLARATDLFRYIDSKGTFFLFKVGQEFLIAAIYLFSDGRFGARVRRLTLQRVFRAKKCHRVVVRSV